MEDLTEEEKLIKIGDIQVEIEDEMEFVDIKPYSHNIISMKLRHIAELGGAKEANRVIEELDLVSLGWVKVSKNDTK